MSIHKRAPSLVGIGLWIGLMMALVGCIEDYAPTAGQGDACRSSAQCSAGLVCQEQVCVEGDPLISPRPGDQDADFAPPIRDVGTGSDVVDPDLPPPPPPRDMGGPGPEDAGSPDLPPDPPDMGGPGPICTPGEQDCADNQTLRICRNAGDGYRNITCNQGQFCEDGQCRAGRQCEDRDGDGVVFGPDCDIAPQDCNDSNPDIFPRAREICDGLDNNCDGSVDETLTRSCETDCGTGREVCRQGQWGQCSARQPQNEVCDNNIDDNCDGRVDENCACCVPDDCRSGEVCLDCACTTAPPDECLTQNQACNSSQVDFSQDYAAIDFSGQGREGTCLGLCDVNARDPDGTCPVEGSVCAFDAGDGSNGFCLGGCQPDTQTGCYVGQGCVSLAGRGACVPAGDTPQGDVCDTSAPFGQCAPGLLCLDFDGGQGTCERLCSPLASNRDTPAVCEPGTECLPFDQDTGVCLRSTNQPIGSDCDRFDQGRPCNEDALCLQVGRQGLTCQKICRLEEGDSDCDRGQRCTRARNQDIPDIGFCN